MSVARIKLLCWVAVAGLAVYLGWEVYHFVAVVKPRLRTPLPVEVQEEVLNVEVPETQDRQLIPYGSVKDAFWLNWTGRKKAEIVPPTNDEGPKAPPRTPVSQLLIVLAIQYATWDPEISTATVLLRYGQNDQRVLRKGDHLPGKNEHVFVSDVRPDYVEFSFELAEGEEPREPERVSPPDYVFEGDLVSIVLISEDGEVIRAPQDSLIPTAPERAPFSYRHTEMTGNGRYQVGTEDARTISENWSHILSNEIRSSRYRDPRTGRYAGIRIDTIKPGSIVTSHGIQAGDVVKSINGEPVSSTQEAISYVKTNVDTTSTWVVVVERQGRDITLTYNYQPLE